MLMSAGVHAVSGAFHGWWPPVQPQPQQQQPVSAADDPRHMLSYVLPDNFEGLAAAAEVIALEEKKKKKKNGARPSATLPPFWIAL